jgi:LacI family transcriptional regulator
MAQNVKVAVKGGHHRIAFISGLDGTLSSQNRLKAFKDTMHHFNLPSHSSYYIEGNFTVECGMQAFREFTSLPTPPTVILTSNDQMAKGAVIMAHETGIKIPRDISIIGYDDIYDAKWTQPPLTTNRQPKYDLGISGAQLLFTRISQRTNQEQVFYELITMPTTFQMRESFRTL